MRSWLPLACLVAGCAAPPPPSSAVFALVAVDAAPATAPAAEPTRANRVFPETHPVPPAKPAAEPTSPPAAGGGSGGGGSGGGGNPPVPGLLTLAGKVLDASNATVLAVDTSATPDPTGAFQVQTSAPELTAVAPGRIARTLRNAPYEFELPPRSYVPGASYPIDGVVAPPLPGVNVRFIDAAGSYATATTDAAGAFHLVVEPQAAGPQAGLIEADVDVAVPALPRPALLQVPPVPQVGALNVTAGETGVSVPLAPLAGRLSIAATPPAGLAAAGVDLRVVNADGLRLAFTGSDGAWPGQVAVGDIPGFRLCVSLVAQDPAGDRVSVVQRLGPADGEAWSPSFLAPPAPAAPITGPGPLRWENPGSTGSVCVTRAGEALPRWEALATGASRLPPLDWEPGDYTVAMRAWDGEPATYPSQPQGAKTDRRYAVTNINWSVSNPTSPP